MPPAASPLGIRAFASAHVGRHVVNEDAFVADAELGLCAVARGIGGGARGEIAAQMAVDAIRRAVAGAPDAAFLLDPSLVHRQRLLAWLGQTVAAVGGAIHARAQQDSALRGMGTTVEVALVRGQSAFLAHAGDGRAYVLREGVLYGLTDDHTLESALVARGIAASDQAAAPPERPVLTRALGVYADAQADVAFYDLAPGDAFLLCTEGVHRHVSPERIRDRLATDPASAAQALVGAAGEARGDDNATAAVLVVERGAFARPPIIGSLTTRLALARSPLFADFTVGELLRVQRIAVAVVLRPGAVLMEQGVVPDGLYLVLEGRMSVRRDGQVVGALETGDPCGEFALVDMPSVITAQAEVPTELLRFPAAELAGLVATDAAVAAKLAFATLARLASRMSGIASSLARYRSAERTSRGG